MFLQGLKLFVLFLNLVQLPAFAGSIDDFIKQQGNIETIHVELSHWPSSILRPQEVIHASARTSYQGGGNTYGKQHDLQTEMSQVLLELAERIGIRDNNQSVQDIYGLNGQDIELLRKKLGLPGASLYFVKRDQEIVILDLPPYAGNPAPVELAWGSTFAEALRALKN